MNKGSQTFEAGLLAQTRRNWQNYDIVRIDLGTVRTWDCYSYAGGFLAVYRVSSLSAAAEVRLNVTANSPIELTYGARIETVFSQFIITNVAQPGEWMDLLIGADFLIDGIAKHAICQPIVNISLAVAGTNYTGPDQPANFCVCTPAAGCLGVLNINFGATSVGNPTFPLNVGDSIRGPINNLNQINVRSNVNNDALRILYEL